MSRGGTSVRGVRPVLRSAVVGLVVLTVLSLMSWRCTVSTENIEKQGSGESDVMVEDGEEFSVPTLSEADETAGVEGTQVPEADADAEKADAAVSEEERLVEEFDAQTDRWMEPAQGGVPLTEIDRFVASFRKLPAARREECLQRALNLVPDENVMLLVGVLMDRTVDRELVELVYNDILNRDEDVKRPILQEIFKNREHPCWADTAWILDVTGELPKDSVREKK